MSNYTKTTNFGAKDALTTGDANKIIRGSEFDTEFDAIATAMATKADTASPALTGTPTAPTASTGTNSTQLATTAFVANAITASTSGVASLTAGTGITVSGATGAVTVSTDSSLIPTLSGSNSFTAANTYTNQVTINSSGNTSKALVVGTTQASAGSDYVFLSKAVSTGPAAAFYAGSSSQSGFACAVNSSNTSTLGVFATGTSPTGATNVVGTITTNGSSTTYGTTSDYRLKTNIVSATNGIGKLKQLNVVNFNWANNLDAGKVDGFIAHEVAEIIPEAVHGVKDAVNADGTIKPQNIDQSKLVPMLTKALQEAVARIEALEADVAALKAA